LKEGQQNFHDEIFRLEKQIIDLDIKYSSTMEQYMKLIEYLQEKDSLKSKYKFFCKDKDKVNTRKVVPLNNAKVSVF